MGLSHDGRSGSSSGSNGENARRCTGWGASRGGTPTCLSCGSSGGGRGAGGGGRGGGGGYSSGCVVGGGADVPLLYSTLAPGVRRRTPTPPPFSEINTTPADSRARRIERSFAAV